MTAALSSMVPTGDNHVTRQVDFAKQSGDAYPLTMVIYAMVPTSGASVKKAAAIARFLDFVAGPGQRRGLNVGELPPGFVPVTAAMREHTRQVATLVAGQAGNPSRQPAGPSATASSPASDPPASSSPSPSTSPTPTATANQRIVTVALKTAQTSNMMRYALPVLLIFGGVATLAGASSWVVTAAGPAISERARRARRSRRSRRSRSGRRS
jgi:hypothetical protein